MRAASGRALPQRGAGAGRGGLGASGVWWASLCLRWLTTNQGLGTPRPRRAGCRHVIAWLAGDGIALAALEAPGQPLRDLMNAHEVGRVDAEAGHVERLEPLAQQALALADQDLNLLSLRNPKRTGVHVARP